MADDHPPPPPPPPSSATTSSDAIWAARLAKELAQIEEQQQVQQLPAGVSKAPGEEVDLAGGRCRLRFQLSTPALAPAPPPPSTTEDAAEAPPTAAPAPTDAVVVEVELGQEETNYPFQPPVLRLLSGRELLSRANVSTVSDDGQEATVVLPALLPEGWTPNTSILDLLTALQEAVGWQAQAEEEGGGMTEAFEVGQALHTAKFTVPIFPCVVRQQGGGTSHRYVGVVSEEWVLALEADRTRIDWVVVLRAMPVLHVAKLKYTRGERLTIIFKGRRSD
jgi:hypothetical protein